MKPITAEWVEKAEGDFHTMERESRARKAPNYDAVCFHAQQCAEKYMKARLVEAGISFPKIHDLVAILELVLPLAPKWEIFRKELATITDYAANFRYPGERADREMAVEAKKFCRRFRKQARRALDLDP